MYARQANNSEEEQILNSLEENRLDSKQFENEEYILVFDESVSNDPIAYARLIKHTEEEELIEKKENTDEDTYIRYHWYELTSVHYSPIAEKQKAGNVLLTEIVNNIKDTTDKDQLTLFDQETQFYKKFGFASVSEDDLEDEQVQRLDEKQTSTKKQISPLLLRFEEFETDQASTTTETSNKFKEEKNKQGFEDENTSTKYSV